MGHMSIGGLDILGIYKNKKIGQISVIGIVEILHNVGYKVFVICWHQYLYISLIMLPILLLQVNVLENRNSKSKLIFPLHYFRRPTAGWIHIDAGLQ